MTKSILNPFAAVAVTLRSARLGSSAGVALLATALLSSGAQAQTRVLFGTAGSLGDASLAVHVAIERGFIRKLGLRQRSSTSRAERRPFKLLWEMAFITASAHRNTWCACVIAASMRLWPSHSTQNIPTRF